MRVFALSDLHVDYAANAKWVANLSTMDYRDDVLILAGDVTDILKLFEWCLTRLTARFRRVLFVPGNHDLWILRERRLNDSFEKLQEISRVTAMSGATMSAVCERGVALIPLFAWYDYSFGAPSLELRSMWMDYQACRWPSGYREADVADRFAEMNSDASPAADTVITFSHFMPRIDLMPRSMPSSGRTLYPVLGTTRLEEQLRRHKPSIHVYGHSHLNRDMEIDGVRYVNNAFGYPSEAAIATRELRCIHQA